MNPLISIIIPVYNAEKYLERCLDSIIKQTYSNFEIIIIDDGSVDHSAKIYSAFAEKDSRIKIIYQKNKGVSSARNRGLSIATGDYIHCVDADDWVDNTIYSELIQTIRENPDIEIIKFNALNSLRHTIGNSPFLGKYKSNNLENVVLQYIGSKKYGGPFILGVPWIYLIKKTLIDKTQLKFEECLHRCEDRLFIISAFLKAKSVFFLNKALYHYTINSDSLSNKYDVERWIQEKTYLSLLAEQYKRFKSEFFIIKANKRIKSDTILRAIITINNIFFSNKKYNFNYNYTQTKKIISDKLVRNAFQKIEKEPLDWKSNLIFELVKYKQALLLVSFYTILRFKNKIKNNG